MTRGRQLITGHVHNLEPGIDDSLPRVHSFLSSFYPYCFVLLLPTIFPSSFHGVFLFCLPPSPFSTPPFLLTPSSVRLLDPSFLLQNVEKIHNSYPVVYLLFSPRPAVEVCVGEKGKYLPSVFVFYLVTFCLIFCVYIYIYIIKSVCMWVCLCVCVCEYVCMCICM